MKCIASIPQSFYLSQFVSRRVINVINKKANGLYVPNNAFQAVTQHTRRESAETDDEWSN